jgi:hypothetical protein
MTFARIRESFLQNVGKSPASAQEAWDHITEGYREALRQGDFPEVFREEVRLSVDLDEEHPGEFLDYVELPCDYMTIYSVFNEEIGAPVNFEPSGWRGRQRFLQLSTPKDTRAKPPCGEVRWMVPMGTRIYLRDTPNSDTTLAISYRIQPPTLSDSDANDHPRTPPQADWAIVWFAAANYYKAHPQIEGASQLRSELEQQAQAKLHARYNPDVEVEKTAFNRMRVAGYRWTPRSRRMRQR